jgi:hypothetical protein
MRLRHPFEALTFTLAILGTPFACAAPIPEFGKLKAKVGADLAATQLHWFQGLVGLQLVSVDAAPTKGFEYEVEGVVKITATEDLFRDVSFTDVVKGTAPRDLALAVEFSLRNDLVGDDKRPPPLSPTLGRYADAATIQRLADRYLAVCGTFHQRIKAKGASWTGRIARTMRYSNGEWTNAAIPAHYVGLPYLPTVPAGEAELHRAVELRLASDPKRYEFSYIAKGCRRGYVIGTPQAVDASTKLLGLAAEIKALRSGTQPAQ